VILSALWVADDGEGLPSRSLLKFSAEQMLSSSRSKPFGGSCLPLETIREKGGAAVASVMA
jgi:hypothetical protein